MGSKVRASSVGERASRTPWNKSFAEVFKVGKVKVDTNNMHKQQVSMVGDRQVQVGEVTLKGETTG